MNLEDEHTLTETDDTSPAESVPPRKMASFFHERPGQVMEVAPQLLRHGLAVIFCSSEWVR